MTPRQRDELLARAWRAGRSAADGTDEVADDLRERLVSTQRSRDYHAKQAKALRAKVARLEAQVAAMVAAEQARVEADRDALSVFDEPKALILGRREALLDDTEAHRRRAAS